MYYNIKLDCLLIINIIKIGEGFQLIFISVINLIIELIISIKYRFKIISLFCEP